MATLDPRIEAVRVQYGLAASDFWELPQKKGTWIAKHAALEMAAVKAGIAFEAPIVLEARGEAKCAALCVTGTLDKRSEWSVGEASPANNKNAYPYAMAEKRGKDRVILKLIGLHGLAYSEDEADDFKAQANGNGHSNDAPRVDPVVSLQDQDITDGVKNWCDKQKGVIQTCGRLPDLLMWLDEQGGDWFKPAKPSPLDRLSRKAPEAFEDLKRFYQAKFNFFNKGRKEAST